MWVRSIRGLLVALSAIWVTTLGLTGCASLSSIPPEVDPTEVPIPLPSRGATPKARSTVTPSGTVQSPTRNTTASSPAPSEIKPQQSLSASPAPLTSAYPDALTGRALVAKFLPVKLKDKSGWATDIFAAFAALQVPLVKEYICAVLAVVEQESSYLGDPLVSGLPGIVRKELEKRRQKYGIPQWAMDKALTVKSPSGSTYNQRISLLKTENDINRLYDDMISELPLGKSLLADYNPVQTGGPMQVSVSFARSVVQAVPYPYVLEGSLRNEVFSRRGGIYFGTAYLLAYPASYDQMIFRFADFNAGRYSSRNAAVQIAVTTLTGVPLNPDGDLLRYRNGNVAPEPSQTMQAITSLGARLKMSSIEIHRDLRLEKRAEFERSPLYERLFDLADTATGRKMGRAHLPEIHLQGPKISRPLTTAWFATRVDGRYRQCLSTGKNVSTVVCLPNSGCISHSIIGPYSHLG